MARLLLFQQRYCHNYFLEDDIYVSCFGDKLWEIYFSFIHIWLIPAASPGQAISRVGGRDFQKEIDNLKASQPSIDTAEGRSRQFCIMSVTFLKDRQSVFW